MTDFEQRHGKVDIAAPGTSFIQRGHGVHSSRALRPTDSTNDTVTRTAATAVAPTQSPLRTYAEWYLGPAAAAAGVSSASPTTLRAIPTVEHFKQLSRAAGRKQEAHLWSLMEDVYTDASRADRYHPDAIGIESAQPHRRWFISQFAHLQAFLQRQPVLRRATAICRWLESTYRDDARPEPRLRGEDDVVLRQLILTHLRGGELQHAIQAAVTYKSCVHSCVLSAAQMQTVPEPWFSQTELVPLFGEYAHGELDQAWCGNEHRLENLSQLYGESLKYRSSHGDRNGSASSASADFDAVIGAALCGNVDVLESAFRVNGSWKDVAWCYLRCALVVAFTKQLLVATGAGGEEVGRPAAGVVDRSYAVFIEEMTGPGDDWATSFAHKLVLGLSARLQSGFLAQAPLEEQLQMRFILQTLTSMDHQNLDGFQLSPTSLSQDLASTVSNVEWFGVIPEENNSEAARLITHVVLAQDVAYGETLSRHAVQVRAGASLAASLARYAVFLALLPRYPFDEGLTAVTAMALRLRDPRHRATVYTAFIRAARDYELERRDLTRGQLEEQEARLVRQFVTADTDPQVHEEVQQLLYQQIAPSEMLTHNKLAEKIMWEAMHADSLEDYGRVLRSGLAACCSFWLALPQPEIDAIADVSHILTRRVLVEIQRCSDAIAAGPSVRGAVGTSPLITSMLIAADAPERQEATFWYLLSEANKVATQHSTLSGQLFAARGNAAFAGAAAASSRTLVFQLTQDEASALHRLAEHTQRALRTGGAVVRRDGQCLSAVIGLVKRWTEEVTLSMLVNAAGERDATAAGASATEEATGTESPIARDALPRMQQVFTFVEELSHAGYFESPYMSPELANALYEQIRTMRVTYGRQRHNRQVAAALRQRAQGYTQ